MSWHWIVKKNNNWSGEIVYSVVGMVILMSTLMFAIIQRRSDCPIRFWLTHQATSTDLGTRGRI